MEDYSQPRLAGRRFTQPPFQKVQRGDSYVVPWPHSQPPQPQYVNVNYSYLNPGMQYSDPNSNTITPAYLSHQSPVGVNSLSLSLNSTDNQPTFKKYLRSENTQYSALGSHRMANYDNRAGQHYTAAGAPQISRAQRNNNNFVFQDFYRSAARNSLGHGQMNPMMYSLPLQVTSG